MLKKCAVCLILIFCNITARAEEIPSTPEAVIQNLKTANDKEGIQVGLIIDPHDVNEPRKIFAKVVTLKDGTYTVNDVLRESRVTLVYHPSYSNCPKAVVITLDGRNSDGTKDRPRYWFLYTSSISNGNVTWQLSYDKGICDIYVSDGDLIGFSRTAARNTGKKDSAGFDLYEPINEPRIKVDSK